MTIFFFGDLHLHYTGATLQIIFFMSALSLFVQAQNCFVKF